MSVARSRSGPSNRRRQPPQPPPGSTPAALRDERAPQSPPFRPTPRLPLTAFGRRSHASAARARAERLAGGSGTPPGWIAALGRVAHRLWSYFQPSLPALGLGAMAKSETQRPKWRRLRGAARGAPIDLQLFASFPPDFGLAARRRGRLCAPPRPLGRPRASRAAAQHILATAQHIPMPPAAKSKSAAPKASASKDSPSKAAKKPATKKPAAASEPAPAEEKPAASPAGHSLPRPDQALAPGAAAGVKMPAPQRDAAGLKMPAPRPA